ncbi:hypothetical protein DEJ27_03090 [Curtobacterium sp. MCPF17_018]|uniref:hypothetical protein n=1 Tax=Curtobacterium sp. MCPF17_018 TaxID=2175638 RepID=UPI000DAAC180|nr:hypothetical protein [Curtobacterium sp. MCPF17_018]PZE71776.1 hypothetical protein DEJ27_03090 [Curtobacterium sp. MCPF17_018]
MTSDACAAFAGVFAVLLLVVPLEGRSLRNSLRAHWAYSLLPAASLVFSVWGVVISANGFAFDGLSDRAVPWVWVPFYGDLIVTAAFLFLLAQQDSDEAEAARQAAVQAAAPQATTVTGQGEQAAAAE